MSTQYHSSSFDVVKHSTRNRAQHEITSIDEEEYACVKHLLWGDVSSEKWLKRDELICKERINKLQQFCYSSKKERNFSCETSSCAKNFPRDDIHEVLERKYQSTNVITEEYSLDQINSGEQTRSLRSPRLRKRAAEVELLFARQHKSKMQDFCISNVHFRFNSRQTSFRSVLDYRDGC